MAILEQADMTDHGMLDYLYDMWNLLEVSYKARVEFMFSMINKSNPTDIYATLERETSHLSEMKQATKGVVDLIRIKESKFGSVFRPIAKKALNLYERRKMEADLFST